MPIFESWTYSSLSTFFKLVEPFLIDMHVTTPEEFDMLYHRMLDEMALDTFRAISFILSVWGETQ